MRYQQNWLTEEQVQQILTATPPKGTVELRDQVVLRLGFTLGLRRQEIADACWGDIDWENNALQLIGKGNKLAVVFVPNKTLAALDRWARHLEDTYNARLGLNEPIVLGMSVDLHDVPKQLSPMFGQHVTGQTIANIVARASERAGIRFTPHDMRRTFAGLMHEKVGLERTSKALRHSNVATTARYLENRPDAAYEAVKGHGLEL